MRLRQRACSLGKRQAWGGALLTQFVHRDENVAEDSPDVPRKWLPTAISSEMESFFFLHGQRRRGQSPESDGQKRTGIVKTF